MNYNLTDFINHIDTMKIINESSFINIIFDDNMRIANEGLDESFEEASARMKAEYEQRVKEMNFAHNEAVKKMHEDFEEACKQSDRAYTISLILTTTVMVVFVAALLKFFYFTKERKYLKSIKDDIMPKIKLNRKTIKGATKSKDFGKVLKLYKENLKLFKELESKVDAVGSSITVSNIKDDSTGASATKKVKQCELYKALLLRSIHQGISESELAIKVYSSKK